MAKLTSFDADIRPLFTGMDIRGMSRAFNLASYDEVKAHAAAIYDPHFGESVAGSCRSYHQEETVSGVKLALSDLRNEWQMDSHDKLPKGLGDSGHAH